MSVEIKPSALRAVNAYKELQAAYAEAGTKLIDLHAQVRDRDAKIAEAKAILDEVFAEDSGGSTGGVVG